MCHKAISKNTGALKYVPDCYKNQEMCNKANENYSHALEYDLECYKTQKMCDKLLILILLQLNLFLNDTKFKKCVWSSS